MEILRVRLMKGFHYEQITLGEPVEVVGENYRSSLKSLHVLFHTYRYENS